MKWKKFKFKAPPVLIILVIVSVLVWLITLIPFPTLTSGDIYEKTAEGIVKTPLSENVTLSVNKLGFFDLFIAPFKGLVDRATFITFILMIGVFIYLLMKTKCIEAGIGGLIRKMKNREYLLIPILMFLISILGAIYGFAEETLALYPILIPIIIAAGFDKMTILFILVLGSSAGVTGSILNPFSIGVAVDTIKGVSSLNVSITTGIVIRVITWLVLTLAFTLFTTIYAIRVKKDPKKSLVYSSMSSDKTEYASNVDFEKLPTLGKREIGSLIVFSLTFLSIVLFSLPYDSWIGHDYQLSTWVNKNGQETLDVRNVGPLEYFHYNTISKIGIANLISPIGQWGFVDYSFLFLISCMLLGFVFLRQNYKEFIGSVYEGWKDMVSLVVMISISSGIAYMLASSNLDKYTTVSLQKAGIDQFPKWAFVLIVFLIYSLLGLIIIGTSTMAILTFPFIAPLAEQIGGIDGGEHMIGVILMVYMLGMSFTGLFTPTNILIMIPIEQYKIPLKAWYKSLIIIIPMFTIIAIALPLFFVFVPIG